MAPLAANLLQNTEFLITVGLLAVVLVAGAVVLYATDRWRRRQDSAPPDSPLTFQHYRELFEAGELTEAEYVKVRDRLTGKPAVTEPPADGNP